MDKNIYEEMSNLRPLRRGRSRAPSSRPPESATADSSSQPDQPATAAAPPATPPHTPDPVGRPLEPSRPESHLVPHGSHLAASLEHLRTKPPTGEDLPATDGGGDQVADGPSQVPEAAPPPPPARAPAPAEAHPAMPEPHRWRLPKRAETQPKRRAARADRKRVEREAATVASRPVLPGAFPDIVPASLSDHIGLSRRERRRARRHARAQRMAEYQQAKEAQSLQRRTGSAQVAVARNRAHSRDYIASLVPEGDWSRRERRRHVRAAREHARTQAASTKRNHRALMREARHRTQTARRMARPWYRPNRQGMSHLLDSRVFSIRVGLAGTWATAGILTWVTWDAGRLAEPELYRPLIGLAAGLLVFTVVPWRRIANSALTSVLVVLWLGMLLGAMVSTAEYHESALSLFIGTAWVILYAGVLLPPAGYAFMASVSLGGYGAAIWLSPVEFARDSLSLRVAALAATAVVVGFTVHEMRKQATRAMKHLDELDMQRAALARRESELWQLYEVSRTIGAGEDLQEVLPELVARTAGYIEAKVGLVVLHRPDKEILDVLSPIWVAGQALEAEGYEFDLDDKSTAASVFASGEAHIRNALHPLELSKDRLLSDLGIERVAAVPLKVEGRAIGVLMVGDKATDFTPADIEALELLASPAGIVLKQLARYEDAQETGRRMAELAQLKSDFVSIVSHELRTPLTSVIGALSTLSRPELLPEDPTARSLLESASNQAGRLKSLIEDLLTGSKIDNDALPLRIERVQIGPVVHKLVHSVPAWEGRMDVSIAPLLPSIAVDVDHFQRIITNLLDNASKYGGDDTVLVTAQPVENEVWISVVDYGEGIPYEYQNTIFERFTQIERPDTRLKGGTGMGLNIVKDLANAMGGRVWLEGTPGGGATFIVAFPRAEDDVDESLQVGSGMLLIDPGRDRVEAPVDMDDLPGSGESPVAE